eukprot:TRINITY_DN5944_c1_g1_i2.p1 TRINITY_DN5944_c1_g1~~TRINITY_DN5944_c1_g1_i2.p1  ORF type:complete len:1130 (-),score=232.93 TRINITY_DN5944_c1_g1_i2:439-3828(-)
MADAPATPIPLSTARRSLRLGQTSIHSPTLSASASTTTTTTTSTTTTTPSSVTPIKKLPSLRGLFRSDKPSPPNTTNHHANSVNSSSSSLGSIPSQGSATFISSPPTQTEHLPHSTQGDDHSSLSSIGSGLLSTLSSKFATITHATNTTSNSGTHTNTHTFHTTTAHSPFLALQLLERLRPSLVAVAHALSILSWPQISQTSHTARGHAIRHIRRHGADLCQLCEAATEPHLIQSIRDDSLRRHAIAITSSQQPTNYRQPSILAQERMMRACQAFNATLDLYLQMLRPVKRQSYLKKIQKAVFSPETANRESKPEPPPCSAADLECIRLQLSATLIEILAAAILLIRPASKRENDLYSATTNLQSSAVGIEMEPANAPLSGNDGPRASGSSEMPQSEFDEYDEAIVAEFRTNAPEIRHATLKLIDFINVTIGMMDPSMEVLSPEKNQSDSAEPFSASLVRTTELLWSSLRDITSTDSQDFDQDHEEPSSTGQGTSMLVKNYAAITKAIGQAFGDRMEDVLRQYNVKENLYMEEEARSALCRGNRKESDVRKRVSAQRELFTDPASENKDAANDSSIRDVESDDDSETQEEIQKDDSKADQQSAADLASELIESQETPAPLLNKRVLSMRMSQSLKRRSALLASDLRPSRSFKTTLEESNRDNHFAAAFETDRIVIQIPDDAVEDVNYWSEPKSEKFILYYLSGDAICTDSKIDRPKNRFRPILAATLNKLVGRLTNETESDPEFEKVFFSTYPTFTSSTKLLAKLRERYNVPPPPAAFHYSPQEWEQEVRTPIQQAVLKSMEIWISKYDYNIATSTSIEIELFLQDIGRTQPEHSVHVERIRALIKARIFRTENPYQPRQESWRNLLQNRAVPNALPTDNQLSLAFEYPADEIARQITIIDHQVYSSIKPFELLHITWSESNLQFRCPNIVLMTQRFNQISAWVAASVVSAKTVKDRVKIISKFVKMAEHLLEYNNFNGMFATTSGLLCSAVHRLRFTNRDLSKGVKKTLQNLNRLMSWDSSYRNYRNMLDRIQPPAVPYLGLFLTDLTFLEHGNPDYCQGMINFHKRELVHRVIEKATRFQTSRYDFSLQQDIHTRLIDLPEADEGQLYQLSLQREPRNATADQINYG